MGELKRQKDKDQEKILKSASEEGEPLSREEQG